MKRGRAVSPGSGQPLTNARTLVLSAGRETPQPIACSGERSKPHFCRLFHVSYPITGTGFMVHTGAGVSIVPVTAPDHPNQYRTPCLQAVNSTKISTYEKRSLTLNVGFCRGFQAIFWIANVYQAIIAASFLRNFHLLVHMPRSQLNDEKTQLSESCVVSRA